MSSPQAVDNFQQAKPISALAFGLLATIQATLIFTITMIGVPLPHIGREFALTSADLVLLLAAYGLPYSGLLLFGGRLADRYGGRRVLLIGLSVFGVASAIAALSPSFILLFAARFTQGIGAALIAPAAVSVVRALFPQPAVFGRAMATWGGVSVIGSVVGFVASGVVTTFVSWRWMFVAPIMVVILSLMAAGRLFPEAAPEQPIQRRSLDPVGAVLATLGISIGSYGLIASGENPWSSSIVAVSLAVGIALLVVFFAVERRVKDPLLPPNFILDRQRLVGLVGILLAAAGAGGLVNFVLSLYLQQARGWSALETAGAFIPFAVVLIVTNSLAGKTVSRMGAGRATIIGLLIAALGLGLLTGLDTQTTYLLGLVPGLVLLACGASLVFSGSTVLSTANVPPAQGGLAGGVMNTAMELGPTVGLAALMSIAATQSDVIVGYAWAFGAASAAFFITAVFSSLPLSSRAVAGNSFQNS